MIVDAAIEECCKEDIIKEMTTSSRQADGILLPEIILQLDNEETLFKRMFYNMSILSNNSVRNMNK